MSIVSAGDNVKFNFPMASSVTLLAMGLYRYPEAYESAGQTDKMLDCIRWPLDYLLKCWNGDSSSPLYYAQVLLAFPAEEIRCVFDYI